MLGFIYFLILNKNKILKKDNNLLFYTMKHYLILSFL